MNCNKKSHFDGVTPVHRRMGEEVGRWGVSAGWVERRIWLCLCLQGGGALTGLDETEEKEVGEMERGARGEEGKYKRVAVFFYEARVEMTK